MTKLLEAVKTLALTITIALLIRKCQSESSSSLSGGFGKRSFVGRHTSDPTKFVRGGDDASMGLRKERKSTNKDDLQEERALLDNFFQKNMFESNALELDDEGDIEGDESLFRKVLQDVEEFSDENSEFSSSEGDDAGRDASSDEDEDDPFTDPHDDDYEKGALYDAYNLLHTLAQDFQKPFDSPAVLVVGHQSSGKSALIEALMGFQFNAVGGGTKTRRPVALRMQYNPRCHSPRCFLLEDDGVERPKSLSEIQEYISRENDKLEKDSVRCFDSREIQIRMEYKYCPNMILIDTPGLIASSRGAKSGNVKQRSLYTSAREVERLVVNKMKCQDYIILCVEDTPDWKHGKTREVVQKVDPDLSRTVIVNTKLDTKVPQFGTSKDVEEFLRAEIVDGLSPQKLGGPFFTSVPSGRVGRKFDDDYLYNNDDDFVQGCVESEESDRAIVRQRLKKVGGVTTRELLPRVGLSRLRAFLEQKVDECYRKNVAKIVPLLQAEHAAASKRLGACQRELDALSIDKLKASADAFCDDFCAAIKDSIAGSVAAPANIFGESLEQESLAAGSFHDIPGCPMTVPTRAWDNLVATHVGNREHRLYGGSQYHRVLREFNLASKCMRLPSITEDEIANAAGVGDTHDGVNFLRASCVIALEKARTSFDPLLEALSLRMMHVMGKLSAIGDFMIRHKQERGSFSGRYIGEDHISRMGTNGDLTQNPQFKQLIKTIFDRFVQKCSDSAMSRCHDDLAALTRFVTWDLHERSSGALRRSLPEHTDFVGVYQVAVEAAAAASRGGDSTSTARKNDDATIESQLSLVEDDSRDRDYYNLLQLMEEAACSRDANRTTILVSGLVQHIVSQWREAFGRSVTTKYNCFFLMPFVEDFHRYMRHELQKVYEGEEDLSNVFDLGSARKALRQRCDDLRNECEANTKLRGKFDMVSKMMRKRQDQEALAEAISQNNDTTEVLPGSFTRKKGQKFDGI